MQIFLANVLLFMVSLYFVEIWMDQRNWPGGSEDRDLCEDFPSKHLFFRIWNHFFGPVVRLEVVRSRLRRACIGIRFANYTVSRRRGYHVLKRDTGCVARRGAPRLEALCKCFLIRIRSWSIFLPIFFPSNEINRAISSLNIISHESQQVTWKKRKVKKYNKMWENKIKFNKILLIHFYLNRSTQKSEDQKLHSEGLGGHVFDGIRWAALVKCQESSHLARTWISWSACRSCRNDAVGYPVGYLQDNCSFSLFFLLLGQTALLACSSFGSFGGRPYPWLGGADFFGRPLFRPVIFKEESLALLMTEISIEESLTLLRAETVRERDWRTKKNSLVGINWNL